MKKISPQLQLEILKNFQNKFVKNFKSVSEKEESDKADGLLENLNNNNY